MEKNKKEDNSEKSNFKSISSLSILLNTQSNSKSIFKKKTGKNSVITQKKIKIDFQNKKKIQKNIKKFHFNEIKRKELEKIIKQADKNIKQSLKNFKITKNLTYFNDRSILYFSNHNTINSNSMDYNNYLNSALVNNQFNISLLKFYLKKNPENPREYYFFDKSLKKTNSREFFSSSSFFKNENTSQLFLTSTVNSIISINDLKKNSYPFFKLESENIINTFTFEKTFGIINNDQIVSFYDIRNPINKIMTLDLLEREDIEKEYLICNDMSKNNNSLLVSSNYGTFYFDLRKIINNKLRKISKKRNSLDLKSQVFLEKRKSISYLDKKPVLPSFKSHINFSKSFINKNNQAFVLDFVEKSLDLYNFNKLCVSKSLIFDDPIYDFSYNPVLEKLAVLTEENYENKEILLFDNRLVLKDVIKIKNKLVNRIGFLGRNGKLIAHSKENFYLFDTEYTINSNEISDLVKK